MTAATRIPESRQRAEAYWFLATLFAAPPGVEQLAQFTALAEQAEGEDTGPAGEILASLRANADLPALAQRLAVEHTRLFGGIREHYGPPPPYEGLWRDGQMMGEATVAVVTAYLEVGFRPDERWSPPDHLVAELQFMAALCHAEDEAWGSGRPDQAQWGRQRQSAFLENHLMVWLPGYCQTLEAEAAERLYQTLARVTAEVLAHDARALRDSAA